jgi:serine protease Do
MLRKLSALFLLSILTCAATLAQDSPQPDEDPARKVFGLAFGGSGSYMGVETNEITRENFAQMGLREVRGVGISRVIKDSPAEKAGLQAGDVIVRFDGEPVTSRRKLTRLIAEVAPDHTANLTVVRSGAEIDIPVTIGKRPSPQLFTGNFEMPKLDIPKIEMPDIETYFPRGKDGAASVWRFSSGRSIGVGVSPLTEQLADYFGIGDGKGLLVNRVGENSPAERAGLRAGDVIVEIDGKKVTGSADLIRSIYEKKEGSINLTIVRNKVRQMITVTPEERKGDGESLLNEYRLAIPEENLKIRVAPNVTPTALPAVIQEGNRIL